MGLHSGAPAQLTLHPARANSGIVFVRTDFGEPVEIPARSSEVVSTALATTLGRGDATVGTVEHLLAALFGLGIDNVRIEVDGPELPVMDGSAAPFVYLIRSAGIFEQREERQVLRIRRKIEVVDGDRSISIEPARDFRVSYAVDFDHPAIRRQEIDLGPLSPERFERDISAARTFGFLREVHALWDAGFARGGSLDNTVVLDDEKVVNPDGLRWPDEFVRHKVLDLCGDLALLGLPRVRPRARRARRPRDAPAAGVRDPREPRRLDDRRARSATRGLELRALVRRRRSHLIARPRGAPPSAPAARPARRARRRRRTRGPCPRLPLGAGRLQATWARDTARVSSPGRWKRTTSGACRRAAPASPRTGRPRRASWRSPRRARPRVSITTSTRSVRRG